MTSLPAQEFPAARTLPNPAQPLSSHATEATSAGPASARPNPSRERPWYLRVFTGRTEDPRWARPALWVLLGLTALTYLYRLTMSGYANDFYAASVKSATQSWRAWLWASLDSQLSITVDKPPAAIWVMGLSARILGFSSFSMLLPNALMGVATVGLTYGAVRRLSGHAAGLMAGAVVLVTPVAALMFRFNNPDSMLVLCVTAAAYLVVRAVQTPRSSRALWWLAGAGWVIGLAFLTKMLQGLLVLPALGLVYLLCAPRGWWTRIWHLLVAVASMVVSAGWLIALCAIWPASSRPYIGGSENNSLWELALGYNGLGRIFGGSGNGGGGQTGGAGFGGNTSFGGQAGLARMFNSAFGTEISWLIPAALLLLVGGLIARGRRPLSDRRRAGLILWGGSMVVTGLVFSFMQGTIHPYYTVALAPLIGGTIGSGVAALWPWQSSATEASDGGIATGGIGAGERSSRTGVNRWAVVVLAVAVAITGIWGFHLLESYASGWLPALSWIALIGSLVGSIVFLLAGMPWFSGGAATQQDSSSADPAADDPATGDAAASDTSARRHVAMTLTLKRVAIGALTVGSLAAAAPTIAWTAATATTSHSGSIPTSGPSGISSGMSGGPGGMGAPGGQNAGPGATGDDSAAGSGSQNGAPDGTSAGQGAQPGGGPGGTAQNGGPGSSSQTGTSQSGTSGDAMPGRTGRPSAGGSGMGGSSTVSSQLVSLLNTTTTKWSAAVISDQSAAPLILATNTAVFSIGGWSGSDNNITLAQFKQYVAEGKIHYFIASQNGGGGMGQTTDSDQTAGSGQTGTSQQSDSSEQMAGPGQSGTSGAPTGGGMPGGMGGSGSGSGSQISSWVSSNFTSKTVGQTTVYDLTSPTS